MPIIAFSGKMGTGKTTISRFFVEEAERRGMKAELASLGTAVRSIAARKYGVPAELMLSQEGKASVYDGILRNDIPDCPRPCTVRVMMQKIAAAERREHPDFTVRELLRAYENFLAEGRLLVIDDMRVPVEYEALKSAGAALVRMQPYPGWDRQDNDVTETALDSGFLWDHVFELPYGRKFLAEGATQKFDDILECADCGRRPHVQFA